MKSFIFCTSFINESGTHSMERYKRWIDFYISKMEKLNADCLFLIDDGSINLQLNNEFEILNPESLPETLAKKVNVISFKNNLGRPSHRDYQGWWRSFTFSIIIAKKYKFDKIIHIESDFFVVSQRLIDYLRNVSKGWTALYSQFHQFPETAIQIICKDAFPKLYKFHKYCVRKNFSVGYSAELCLPFTNIEKSFKGDRLGQLDVLDGWLRAIKTPIKLDYIGQVLPQFKPDDFTCFFELEFDWH